MKQQCIIAAKKLWNHPTLCVELSTGGFKRERDDSIMIIMRLSTTMTNLLIMVTMIRGIMVVIIAVIIVMIHDADIGALLWLCTAPGM